MMMLVIDICLDAEKASDDQNDLVTNQLMNLSDLVVSYLYKFI